MTPSPIADLQNYDRRVYADALKNAPLAEQRFADWAERGDCPYEHADAAAANVKRIWFDQTRKYYKPHRPVVKATVLARRVLARRIFVILKESGL